MCMWMVRPVRCVWPAGLRVSQPKEEDDDPITIEESSLNPTPFW